MKTAAEWNQDIINISMKIHEEFPELSNYLEEMPVNVLENQQEGINSKNLEEYYHSLEELIGTYAKTHAVLQSKG